MTRETFRPPRTTLALSETFLLFCPDHTPCLLAESGWVTLNDGELLMQVQSMHPPEQYPQSIETIDNAHTASGAVKVAAPHIDECGSVRAFIDVAQAAFLNGHTGPIPQDILDDIEFQARAHWREHNRTTAPA